MVKTRLNERASCTGPSYEGAVWPEGDFVILIAHLQLLLNVGADHRRDRTAGAPIARPRGRATDGISPLLLRVPLLMSI